MKPAILLVAFGTASASAWEIYDGLEEDVRAAFPACVIRWAWTSLGLVARLRGQGKRVFTLGEALASLGDHDSAAVLSLHLVPGEKHREILAEDHRGLCLAYGRPLLASWEDADSVAEDLLADLPPDRPVLVVAHGHPHEERYNTELRALGEALARSRPDVHLTLLEGNGDGPELAAFARRARALGRVHVAPFFLVAGDHVQKDILGAGPDSLKSRLAIPDFTWGEELGRKPWVRRRFLARLAGAMATLEDA